MPHKATGNAIAFINMLVSSIHIYNILFRFPPSVPVVTIQLVLTVKSAYHCTMIHHGGMALVKYTEAALTVRTDPITTTLCTSLLIECNCSNNSDACLYDPDRRGGVCVNCTDNTSGTNCQDCATGYYNNGQSCTGK